jgi:hypothetical protein
MKDGIVLQEKDSTGAIWLWINNATNSHPSVWPDSLYSPCPPENPTNVMQYGETRHDADLVQHKVEPHQSTAMGPSLPPAAGIVATAPPHQATSDPALPTNITAASCPAKHRAVVAMLIVLTEGVPGKNVRMEEWMDSLRQEYPGARKEFLLSLIAEAEEDGVMTRRRDKNGVVWTWLNPAKVT